MKWFVGILTFVSMHSIAASGDKLMSKDEYIDTWKQVAVQQMIEYKIPASITLAQGILESANGNSDLAKKGNNHFGIKCHDWKGDKMFLDDDAANECFRVYANGEESYKDHSLFLKNRARYAKLFSFTTTDYKSWATGLKDAGYATNPKYADQLIETIENLKLYQLDVLGQPVDEKNAVLLADNQVVKHELQIHSNKVKFVIAKKGDTFYKIAKEFEMGLWQLYRYNDYGLRKDVLIEGDIVYLQPKRHHAKVKMDDLKLEKEMSLREVSQAQAIRLKTLEKLNKSYHSDEKISKGQIVHLR